MKKFQTIFTGKQQYTGTKTVFDRQNTVGFRTQKNTPSLFALSGGSQLKSKL